LIWLDEATVRVGVPGAVGGVISGAADVVALAVLE
jgi:hypothetical protein